MDPLSLTYALGSGHNRTHVRQDFDDVTAWANGLALDADDIPSSAAEDLGLSQAGTVRRGKSTIATEESRTNTSYGTLTTPDQVASVVLPTDGLIAVAYQAMWKESVLQAARAAVFVGANQLKVAASGNGPYTQAAVIDNSSAANIHTPLASSSIGLVSNFASGTQDLATTGQVVGIAGYSTGTSNVAYDIAGTIMNDQSGPFGGPCYIFAAAGTYTISVQFKASSGSVTVKNRKLWCWTLGF